MKDTIKDLALLALCIVILAPLMYPIIAALVQYHLM